MSYLANELKKRSGGLTLTYGLSIVENIFDLLYPFAIGIAVNGLIAQSPFQLVPLVVIWLCHTGIGYWRQRFDTRLFTQIYAHMAKQLTLFQRDNHISTSEIAARTDMVEELVEFMEEDIPTGLLAIFAIFGGIAMLMWYDIVAGLMMSMLLPPTAFLYWRFARKARHLEGQFNNQAELEVDLIGSGSAHHITTHFESLAKYRIQISDTEANTWSLIELLALIAFVVVLIRLTLAAELAAGDIVAAIAYALRVIEGLDILPNIISSFSRMLDNLQRINIAPPPLTTSQSGTSET